MPCQQKWQECSASTVFGDKNGKNVVHLLFLACHVSKTGNRIGGLGLHKSVIVAWKHTHTHIKRGKTRIFASEGKHKMALTKPAQGPWGKKYF
jgi:hypothetical protein